MKKFKNRDLEKKHVASHAASSSFLGSCVRGVLAVDEHLDVHAVHFSLFHSQPEIQTVAGVVENEHEYASWNIQTFVSYDHVMVVRFT